MSPRPKPTESLHEFHCYLPMSVWDRLVVRAAHEHRSINKQILAFVEAGLLDSPIVSGRHPRPGDLSLLNTED